MCLKKLSLVLVLSLLLLSASYSDVTLTDQEYEQIMTALTISEMELTEQETTIINQGKTIEQLESKSEQLKTSLEEQRKERIIEIIKWVLIAFFGGVVTGILAE